MTQSIPRPSTRHADEIRMTPAAVAAVQAEARSIESELAAAAGTGQDMGDDRITIAAYRLEHRLGALRSVLERHEIEPDPSVVATGSQVVLADGDGVLEAFRLVLPGDGDPGRGWVAVDAPLGLALVGRRAGDVIEVRAPAGTWTATLVEVR